MTSDHGPVALAPTTDLLDAAITYLHEVGINPDVIGGIEIMHVPGERRNNHRLAIKFTAKLPDYLPPNAPEVTQ